MKELMVTYAVDLQNLLKKGWNLREISKWSYGQRQSGRNVPYMAIILAAFCRLRTTSLTAPLQ